MTWMWVWEWVVPFVLLALVITFIVWKGRTNKPPPKLPAWADGVDKARQVNRPGQCTFCRKGEDSNRVTTAFDFGFEWPDGRTFYTLACDECAVRIFRHQSFELGKTFTCAPVTTVEIVPPCKTLWRSHGCKWPADTRHEHECSCGDRPRDDDTVY